MRERPQWEGWLLVAAWAVGVALVFWLLVAPPWEATPPAFPTTMGRR